MSLDHNIQTNNIFKSDQNMSPFQKQLMICLHFELNNVLQIKRKT